MVIWKNILIRRFTVWVIEGWESRAVAPHGAAGGVQLDGPNAMWRFINVNVYSM